MSHGMDRFEKQTAGRLGATSGPGELIRRPDDRESQPLAEDLRARIRKRLAALG
jgi:hypothetical protein